MSTKRYQNLLIGVGHNDVDDPTAIEEVPQVNLELNGQQVEYREYSKVDVQEYLEYYDRYEVSPSIIVGSSLVPIPY